MRELDEAARFDDELYAQLAELGVLGLGGPESLGGVGDVRDQVVVVEELAAGPTSMAAFTILQYMIIQVLDGFGAGAQRDVLREVIHGRSVVSFCMSEPGGGTDVARAMRTRAERSDDGFRVSGGKTWITAASRADHLLVLARTRDYEKSPVDGVTAFLVPRDRPGIEVREIPTFGLHSVPTCEVFLDSVPVRDDEVVGEVDRGFRSVFGTLNRERLNAAAACLGVGRGALEYSVRYASEREAFGRAIGGFQTLQHRLVDGGLALESARALIVRAAEVEAAGGRADVLSTLAKLAAARAASAITEDGMRLLAGVGFSREYPMQRWLRDVRLWNFAPVSDEMAGNYLGERWLQLPRSY